jgi:hypothetical protein
MNEYIKYVVFDRMALPCCLVCGSVLMNDWYVNKHFNSLHDDVLEAIEQTERDRQRYGI